MSKTALVTGASGQDGAYLAKLLLDKGYSVHGTLRRHGLLASQRLAELGIEGDVVMHDLELLELTNIQRVLDDVRPDEVYNLAAQSFVGKSFDQPLYTADVDAFGPLRILEALRSLGARARYYQASTSEMFGSVKTSPQDENTMFKPRSPYGIAKLFSHWSTINYREAHGLHATCGILFNHESPLRGAEFVTRKITYGLARVKCGLQDWIELGNLESARDWGFAGDYVEAMWAMLQQEEPDDYVIATQVAHTVREFVEGAGVALGMRIVWRGKGLEEAGVDDRTGRPVVKIDRSFMRPAEVDHLVGNAAKARRKLGWQPRVGFEQLIAMMCQHDYDLANRGTQVKQGVGVSGS